MKDCDCPKHERDGHVVVAGRNRLCPVHGDPTRISSMSQFERETTVEERMAWGDCPTCGARHGEPCNPEVGFPVGRSVDGRPPTVGAHVGRLRGAPMRVRLVPA